MPKKERMIIIVAISSLALLVAGISMALPGAGGALPGAASTLPGAGGEMVHDVSSATINVSGTVTGPGGPADGVTVSVISTLAEVETTTGPNGQYSVNIEQDGQFIIQVRPPFDTPLLSQANYHLSGITGDVTQNVTLSAAHLLQLTLAGSEGSPITSELQLEIQGLINKPPGNQWYNLEKLQPGAIYQAALPADIYYVTVKNPPAGHYQTIQPFDLQAGDLTATMVLNDQYVHPIPYEPPDAGKITIGPPDSLGEALVSGDPGAALPLAQVLLVNLSSTHQSDAISEADGSFTARIYAPPGSAIQIKHGPASHRWWDLDVGIAEGINPFDFVGEVIKVQPASQMAIYVCPRVGHPSARQQFVGC